MNTNNENNIVVVETTFNYKNCAILKASSA